MQCRVGAVGSLLESARAKEGAWESVVEDGELVVGGSTVCVGSANLTKNRRRGSDDA